VLLAPGLAHAKPAEENTALTNHVALRYGVFLPQDDYIQRGFGDNTNKLLRLDFGWSSDKPVLSLFEAGLNVGFVHEDGYLYTEDGTKSADEEVLEILPVGATLTLRLNLVDEQLLVPFIRGGGDAWLWRETWDVPVGDDDDGVRYGGKLGAHWAAGGALLLDALDPSGASKLEARTGVNDTYIVGEYRQTYMMHGDNQIDLSANEVTFGFKFDF
jgi:hypothetical protein